MNTREMRQSATGFSLIETMIALVVLAVGVLGLAAMLATGLKYMSNSQDAYIAQEKAEEAVEAIYTARDIQQTSWANINNTALGGIFLGGPQPLCNAGPDGIVGTADDNCNLPDAIIFPGPDGKLGTADDIRVVLSNFQRTITISGDPQNPNSLRQIQVTVTYISGGVQRSYTLNSLISRFS